MEQDKNLIDVDKYIEKKDKQEEKKEEYPKVEKKFVINWDEYEEVETIKPKPGEMVKGIVVNIDKGELKDFINEERLTKWNKEPEAPVINVEVEYMYRDNVYKKNKIISLPGNKKINKKSKLYKWKKKFGNYPYISQEVYLIADGDGFFQLLD